MIQARNLLDHAKRMRHEATPFEVVLWRHLSNSQLGSFKFRRQHVIDGFIVDFFCPSKNLIVEVDGDSHDAVADVQRDQRLAEFGYRTLRFSNPQIAREIDGVLETILKTLQAAPDRWAVPHPSPSTESRASVEPKGEGL